MYRIRPIQETDFDTIFAFANQSGLGLTSLPKNKDHLKEIVENGVASFKKTVRNPFYFFVLEDQATNELLGTAGINAKTTFNNYLKLEAVELPHLFEEVPSKVTLLKRVEYAVDSSEICALYLSLKARKEGFGKLLSFSRFHFMAAHPELFTKTVFAILRGVIDNKGESPFWEAVGRHFLPIDFAGLMEHRDVMEAAALDLMPKSPLYLELLPESARKVVGEPHNDGRGALEMLINQGFTRTGEVDIYEGGPRVSAKISQIKTVKESSVFQIQSIENELSTSRVHISNEQLQFRACYGKIDLNKCAVDQDTATLLEVDVGDKIRWSP